MNKILSRLKDAVKDLFAGKKVDLVIGYENGSIPFRSRPCFVSSADSADKLVWNYTCTNNLTVYLPRYFQAQVHKKGDEKPPKIGIVVKGCDARSVVGLLKEHQIPRENVIIIGMPCTGMADTGRVEAALDGDDIVSCEEGFDGTLEVTTSSGGKKTVKIEEVIARACLECSHPLPEGADVQIEGKSRGASDKRYDKVMEFEAKSPDERWQYFIDEISKCIRCHACRQVCPNCYCKVCFVDQTKPRWVGASDDISDVILYHIVRLFHQAGRCVECDACVAACPMGINLRLFAQKLGKDVQELFGYVPGLSVEELPPLCAFKQDDNQSFITKP
jgi:ferredoxin